MTRKGYKQTSEHIAARIKRGPEHPNWIGDAVSKQGGRSRALRAYPPAPCEACGKTPAERHHVDGNTANNQPENVRMLCRPCHTAEHRPEVSRSSSSRAPALIRAAAAARRARTHCKRGHPLSGPNLYVTPQGRRGCKQCQAMHVRAYQSRKRAN